MPDNITSQLVSSLCPERPADGHKGTFGMALIIAGSRYMPGAQTLAAMSALRSGVGMVRVFAPDDSLMSTSINCPCALLSAWGDTVSSALRQFDMYLKKATAVGIGPGLDEKDPRSYALLQHADGPPVAPVRGGQAGRHGDPPDQHHGEHDRLHFAFSASCHGGLLSL